jgi:hypothetical protein
LRTIAEEINALRELPVAELVERYRATFGKEPRIKNKVWLWKRIGWRLQEQRLGGLSEVAKARLEQLIAEIDLPLAERARSVTGKLRRPRGGELKVGTVLTREWRGQEVRVTVVENGFECDGVVYKSLSAVAKAVTGSHWNGKLFFGLTPRRAAK